MCSWERGEVFIFEDLVFTIREKTAPNFFPEILIPPRAANSQGPDRGGDAGSGYGGNDGDRAWLLCCLQTLPSAEGALPGGVVLLWQVTQVWGREQ